jgi:hypothetical protein
MRSQDTGSVGAAHLHSLATQSHALVPIPLVWFPACATASVLSIWSTFICRARHLGLQPDGRLDRVTDACLPGVSFHKRSDESDATGNFFSLL